MSAFSLVMSPMMRMARPGPGKGWRLTRVLRQPQLPAQLPDFVFEEHPQRLDDLLKVHKVGQAADIVVALNGGGLPGAGLNHVGVDGALCQEVHSADLLGLLLKDADELLPNDFPFALRLVHPSQFEEEAGLCVHAEEADVPLGKGGFHLVALREGA